DQVRHDALEQVVGHLRLSDFPPVGLKELGWIPAGAKEYPNDSHRGRPRAEKDAQLLITTTAWLLSNFGKDPVRDLEQLGVIGRVGQLDRVDDGLAAKPRGKGFVDDGRIVA